MEYHRNVIVTGSLIWAAGTVQGNSTHQPEIFVEGSLNFVDSGLKYLQSVKLLLQSDAVWAGYGDLTFGHSSEFHIQLGARFTIDTTGSVLSDEYSNSVVDNGEMVISENRDVNMRVHLHNTGSVVLQPSSSLALSGNSYWTNGSIVVAGLSFVRGAHRILSNTQFIMSSTSIVKVQGGDVHVESFNIPGHLQVIGGTMTIDKAEPTSYQPSVSLSNSGILTISGNDGNSNTILNLKDVTVSSSQYLKINRRLHIDHLVLKSGSVLGSADISIQNLTWNGGSLSGRRGAVVNVTSAMIMDGVDRKQIFGRHVVVSGQGMWIGMGDLVIQDGGTLDVMNKTRISIDAHMTLKSAEGGLVRNYGELIYSPQIDFKGQLILQGSIVNYGLISARRQTGLTLGLGVITYGTVEVTDQLASVRVNLGDVVVKRGGRLKTSGDLVVSGGQLLVEGQLVASTVKLDSGNLMIVNESNHMLLEEITVSGRSREIGHFMSLAPLLVQSVRINGGTLELNAPSQLTSVTLHSGSLSSNVNLTEIGHCVWYGGSVTGHGILAIRNATIHESSAAVPLGVRPHLQLFLQGVVEFVGSPFDFSVEGGAVVTVEVGSIVKFTEGHRLTAAGRIVNLGTIEWRSQNSQQAIVAPQLENRGHIAVKTGTLQLSGKCINHGRIDVDLGAPVTMMGGFYGAHSSITACSGKIAVHSDVYFHFAAFDVWTLEVRSGVLDLVTTTDRHVFELDQLGGTIRVTCQEGAVLWGHLVHLRAGTMDIIGEARFWQTTLEGGNLRMSQDPVIENELIAIGGSVSGMFNPTKVRLTAPILRIDDSATHSSSNRLQISFNNLEILVAQTGSWIAGSHPIQLSGDSQITVLSGATFNISLSSSTPTISGGTLYNLGHINVFDWSFASSSSLSVNGDFVNLGVFKVLSDIVVRFQGFVRCSSPGSISADTQSLSFYARAELNCSVSLTGMIAGKNSAVRLSAHGSLQLDSLTVAEGLVEVFNNRQLSLIILEIISGTVKAADGVNVTITVSEMWKCRVGTVTGISIRSLRKSDVSQSLGVTSSRIAVGGQATFTDSVTTLNQHSVVHFIPGSVINVVRDFVVNGRAADDVGTVVNDGFIRASWCGTLITMDAIFHHRGTVEMDGMATQFTVGREYHMDDGIVVVLGAHSAMNLRGSGSSSTRLNSSSSFCDSCLVSLAGGILLLVARSEHLWRLPSLTVSEGQVTIEADMMVNGQMTLDDVLVTGDKSVMQFC